jgi:hypothetical protein
MMLSSGDDRYDTVRGKFEDVRNRMPNRMQVEVQRNLGMGTDVTQSDLSFLHRGQPLSEEKIATIGAYLDSYLRSFVPAAAGQPRPVQRVALNKIKPLSGFYGISNRHLDMSKVNRMAATWDEAACGIMVVYAEAPDGPYYLLSGHHRHKAMQLAGHSPTRQVNVDIVRAADLGDRSIQEGLLYYVHKCNLHKGQNLGADLSNVETNSPWFAEFRDTHGMQLAYDNAGNSRELSYPAVVKAYLMTQLMTATIAAGKSVDTALSVAQQLNITPKHLKDAYAGSEIDAVSMKRAISAVVKWEAGCAEALASKTATNRGQNVRTPVALAFVMLVYNDALNSPQILARFPDRFVNPSEPFAVLRTPSGSPVHNVKAVFGHMLKHANKRLLQKSRYAVLGSYEIS